MTVWIAFVASMILFVTLPNPQRQRVAVFSHQRGRWTALITVPALLISAALGFVVAMAPLAAIVLYEPDLVGVAGLIGVAVLIAHFFWLMRNQGARTPLADNDNLPERRLGPAILKMMHPKGAAFRRILALCGLLAQFVTADLDRESVGAMFSIFLALTLVSGVVVALFPRLGARNGQRPVKPQASGKPRTVYIARRAVTAGFRRIAA